MGSGSPSLALRTSWLSNRSRSTNVHVDLTVYPNFHCSIYSYIIIIRLIKNFMFFIFVIIFTYEIKSTTKFSRFTVHCSRLLVLAHYTTQHNHNTSYNYFNALHLSGLIHLSGSLEKSLDKGVRITEVLL